MGDTLKGPICVMSLWRNKGRSVGPLPPNLGSCSWNRAVMGSAAADWRLGRWQLPPRLGQAREAGGIL